MENFKPIGIKVPRFLSGTLKNGIQLLYSGMSYLEFLDLMKKDNPNSYNRLLMEVARDKSSTSEIVRYTDANGNVRNTTNVRAGYVSGTDPVGQLVVEGTVMNKPLLWAGKGMLYGLGRAGNNWARSKLISREMNKGVGITSLPTILLGIQSGKEPAKNMREAVLNSMKGRRLAEEAINNPVVQLTKDYNTRLYKRATGKDARYKYKKETDGFTRILPNEDFNKSISVSNTTAPKSATIENIGGYYRPSENLVVLRDNTSIGTAFHEYLHSLRYGESPATEWIASHLWDPTKKIPAYYKYPGETAVHSLLLGRDWNVKIGLKYPGDKAFDELLENNPIGGAPYYFKRTTSKDKRRFWRAITGLLFGLSPLIGMSAVHGINNENTSM